MAKGITKELVASLTRGIDKFSSYVDKLATGAYSFTSFQKNVDSFSKSVDRLNNFSKSFDQNLKNNITELKKVKLDVDASKLKIPQLESKKSSVGTEDSASKAFRDAQAMFAASIVTSNQNLKGLNTILVKLHTSLNNIIQAYNKLGVTTVVPQPTTVPKPPSVPPPIPPPKIPPSPQSPEGPSPQNQPQIPTAERESYFKSNIAFTMVQSFIAGITQLKDQTEELRRTLLGYGTDTEKFSRFLGGSIDGLRGSTLENLKNAASLYSDGFRGNNRGLLQVANRLDATNQSNQFLLKEFPNLALSLRMSSDEMNSFAVKIDNAAVAYGVSTQKVVEGLSKIKILDDAINLGEYGQQFARNITAMNTQFAGMDKQIEKFVNSLFENEQEVIAMGGGQLLSQLEKAANPEQFKDALAGLGELMASRGEMFADQAMAAGEGGRSMFQTMKEMRGVFGDVAFEGMKFNDALKGLTHPAEATADANKEFYDSLQTATKEFLNNFVPAMTMVVRAITGLANGFNSFINFFGKGGPIILTFLTLAAVVRGIVAVIGKAVLALQSLAAAARAAATSQAASSAGGAVAGMAGARLAGAGLGRLVLGALGGPLGWIGTALTVGIPLIGSLMASSNSTKEKTLEEVREQRRIQKQALDEQLKQAGEKKREDSMSFSREIFSSINKDLMFAVTNMRLDTMAHLENVTKQTELLGTLVRQGQEPKMKGPK